MLAIGFAALIVVGTGLLMLPPASASGEWTDPLVALFTATSAVCVTGLVVADTGTYWSTFGQVVILVLVQVGGLGFMTSATLLFLVVGRRLSLGDRIVAQEALGTRGPGGVGGLIRRIVVVSAAIEAIGAVLLFLRFRSDYGDLYGAWASVFYSISAFNNAGFDLTGGFRSLTIYSQSPYILLTIAALVILGSISYFVMADVAKHRWFRPLALDTKLVLVMTGALLGGGTLLILASEINNPASLAGMTWLDKLVNAFFFVVMRTGGFSSVPLGQANDETLLFTLGFMFIGGASASTAGGIKVTTAAVLLIAVVSSIRGWPEVHVFRSTISMRTVIRAMTVAALSFAVIVVITLVVALAEPMPVIDLLFEVTSAFGTVGYSTGITPDLTVISKLAIIGTMFFGRVGPLTLALALAGRERTATVRYVESSVRIG